MHNIFTKRYLKISFILCSFINYDLVHFSNSHTVITKFESSTTITDNSVLFISVLFHWIDAIQHIYMCGCDHVHESFTGYCSSLRYNPCICYWDYGARLSPTSDAVFCSLCYKSHLFPHSSSWFAFLLDVTSYSEFFHRFYVWFFKSVFVSICMRNRLVFLILWKTYWSKLKERLKKQSMKNETFPNYRKCISDT